LSSEHAVTLGYSRITYQTLHSFSPMVQTLSDENKLPVAHSVFKHSVKNSAAASQLQYAK